MHGAYSLTVTMTALTCNFQDLKSQLLRCVVKLPTAGMVKYIFFKKQLMGLSSRIQMGGCVGVMLTGAVSIVTSR